MRGIKISYDVADQITLACLKDHRHYMQRDLMEYENGDWMHPKDVQDARRFLDAVNEVIKYFGEEKTD